MANAFLCCYNHNSMSPIKLVFWEGNTKTVKGKWLAGELMFQYPDRIVCHADSFYIGRPIPQLSISDELVNGEMYLLLPMEQFSCKVLSVASLYAMSSPNRKPMGSGQCPFQYIKGANGRLAIKVLPEFIARIISGDCEKGCSSSNSPLCSTPELKKLYDQLVGSKEQLWSPKLETISEFKTRLSPGRLLGLEWGIGKVEE